MNDKDAIKDLFQEKLQSHEVVPSNSVWSGVSSSLGHSAASASGFGAASFLKVAAAIVGVSSIGIAAYVFLSPNDTSSPKETKHVTVEETIEQEMVGVQEVQFTKEVEEKSAPKQVTQSKKLDNKTVLVYQEESLDEALVNEILPTPQETDVVSIPQEGIIKEIPVSLQNTLDEVAPQEAELVSEGATGIEDGQDSDIETSDLYEEEITQEIEKLVLPNVFTPNGDRVNDVFEIVIGEKLEFQIVILNQANELVFTSTDPSFKWEGTLLNGEEAPVGHYVYFISAKDMNGEDFVKSSILKIQR